MTYSAQRDRFVHERLPPAAGWPELILDPPYDYPERLNCAARLLDAQVALGHGDRPAIYSDAGVMTYGELLARANRIAHFLVADLALVPGNRVLIRGANSADLAAIWLATQKAGMVAVTTMELLRARELATIIEMSQPAAAFCATDRLDDLLSAAHADGPGLAKLIAYGVGGAGANAANVRRLDEAVAEKSNSFDNCPTAATDVSLIGFTSGTTGKPKATVHFHRDVVAICDGVCRHIIAPTPDDIFIGTPPFGFTYGLGALLLFPLYGGAAAVLGGRTDPASLLAAIADFRATVCFTAPTFYRRMAAIADAAETRRLTRSLRMCVASGEALPPATRDAWRAATGIDITEQLGSTEMLHGFIAATGADVRPGKIGRAVPGYTVAALGHDGTVLPAGEIGRLAVKGPTGCRYLDDPRQADYVQGGWNITGDLCAVDAAGYVSFHGRSDDMIITSGHNVSAVEVEAALMSHDAVAECAVVGVPDDIRGQVVRAFVVANGNGDPGPALARALQAHVKATIAPYKYPRQIQFIDTLPRNASGKVQRFRLR